MTIGKQITIEFNDKVAAMASALRIEPVTAIGETSTGEKALWAQKKRS